MLNSLLSRLRIILIMTFVFGSIVFYYILDDYHTRDAYATIQKNVIFSEAMQKYVSDHLKPAVYKLTHDGNISKDFFDPALLSSTFIISTVNKIFQQNALKENLKVDDVEFRFASDNPTNPVNKANKFESEVLKKFNNSHISSYSKRMEHNGKDTLFFALASRANTEDCLKCHGNPKDAPKDMIEMYGDKNGFHEKVGEIRSINAVYSAVDSSNNMLKFFLAVEFLMFSVFLAIYFVVRYFIVKLSEKDKFIAKQSKFAAMGEMIGMIAHQWRQPLTGMGMSINNLLLDIELQDIDEKRFQESLELINKQIAYLSTTIDDFKNFFRPGIEAETVNVAKLVKESCMIIDSSIKSSGVEIKLNISDDLTIFTKKNDVTQIILNLVKNSMDAYEENKIENKIIEISAVDKPKRVEIIIKDYAGGIPKEIIDKIFDPYFSTKDKKNGTGLGLYMSKMIAEDHLCGYLDVETKSSSTTFKIELIKKGCLKNGH